MEWRLGLDLGTNSIGWAAIKLLDAKPVELLDLGSRIFSDGRAPSRGDVPGEPLAVERRAARGARRLRERRRRRIRSMVALVGLGTGLNGANPYQLRAEALERPLSDDELSRVLIHLARRRGFQSNRKDSISAEGSDQAKELKGLKLQIKNLESSIGTLTLGQYLWRNAQNGHSLRFKKNVSAFYPSRAMYRDEFQRIRAVQESSHPNVAWDDVERVLFFQRPLRPVERGCCTFYTTEPRAFKALPSSHRVRIVQELLNLKKVDDVQQIPLTKAEFDRLYVALETKPKLTFGQMRKELGGIHTKFNLESETRSELKGNVTSVAMRKILGGAWDELSLSRQDEVVETLIQADDSELTKELGALGLTEGEASKLAETTFAPGTTSVCARFQQELLDVMVGGLVPYFEATAKLGFHHSDLEHPEVRDRLPYYGEIVRNAVMGARPTQIPTNCQNPGIVEELTYGKINNPTVHIALRQLQKLVNRLIDRFGKPSEIVLELARDLKVGQKELEKIVRQQAENQKVRDSGKRFFSEIGYVGHLSDIDHRRFKLWSELGKGQNNHQCLYCGRVIGGNALINGEVEIEHILPYSRTLDNSFGNLTLAHRSCNQFKGDRTPHEAFGNSPEGYDWSAIRMRSQDIGKERKFHPDAMKRYEESGGFIDRQLTDTAYMSRVTKQYLACITPPNKIWSSPGRLTAELRAEWGFNTLLNRGGTWFKNRTDHRHHALDGLVIALSDRAILQEVSRLNGQNRDFKHKLPVCPISRETIQDRLKTVLVSHKPDHGYEGRLYAETALGKAKELVKLDLTNPDDLDKLEDEVQLKTIRPVKIREFVVAWAHQYRTQKKSQRWFASFKTELAKRYSHLIVARTRYVSRTEITSWNSWKEITERWIDPHQQHRLRQFIEMTTSEKPENLDKKTLQTMLQRFSEATAIKRIRYEPKDKPDEAGIPSAPFKYYSAGDYFCVDIWAIPRKGTAPRYQGVFVSRLEAYKNPLVRTKPDPKNKPHPAAKYVVRLHKRDCIAFELKGSTLYGYVAGFATKKNQIDIQTIWNAGTQSEWIESTNPTMVQPGWPFQKAPQNHMSINTIFETGMARKLEIAEDGGLRFR
jgi:CRISPR-associated endonuclease Csn1